MRLGWGPQMHVCTVADISGLSKWDECSHLDVWLP